MKLLKSKAISILISLFIFAIFTFIYTILVYNGKIKAKANDIYRFSIIIGAISFFLIGLISGIVEKKYGIISNFITGLILLIIIIVIKLLSKSTLEGTDWLKYGIYLITISLGGMIGVQLDTRKKTSNKHK